MQRNNRIRLLSPKLNRCKPNASDPLAAFHETVRGHRPAPVSDILPKCPPISASQRTLATTAFCGKTAGLCLPANCFARPMISASKQFASQFHRSARSRRWRAINDGRDWRIVAAADANAVVSGRRLWGVFFIDEASLGAVLSAHSIRRLRRARLFASGDLQSLLHLPARE